LQRGLFAGGQSNNGSAPFKNNIEYINIASTGNAIDFVDLTVGRIYFGAGASSTRAVWAGGYPGESPYVNTIDYVTILTTGNAIDFGDVSTAATYGLAGTSNSTRFVLAGGTSNGGTSTQAEIYFVTIATLGNTSSFGSLTQGRMQASACASTTRGLFCGGYAADEINASVNIIDYITIATTGSAADFGDLLTINNLNAACSSSTRGCIGGGNTPSGSVNVIQYVTIASTGNSIDFGDLTTNRNTLGATSSPIRGVWSGGNGDGTVMDFVTIATTGNATSFGNLTTSLIGNAGTSNCHGGL
jgi:hypothetical protein